MSHLNITQASTFSRLPQPEGAITLQDVSRAIDTIYRPEVDALKARIAAMHEALAGAINTPQLNKLASNQGRPQIKVAELIGLIIGVRLNNTLKWKRGKLTSDDAITSYNLDYERLPPHLKSLYSWDHLERLLDQKIPGTNTTQLERAATLMHGGELGGFTTKGKPLIVDSTLVGIGKSYSDIYTMTCDAGFRLLPRALASRPGTKGNLSYEARMIEMMRGSILPTNGEYGCYLFRGELQNAPYFTQQGELSVDCNTPNEYIGALRYLELEDYPK